MEPEPTQGAADGYADLPALDELSGPVADAEAPEAPLEKTVAHDIGIIEEAGHCAPELLAHVLAPAAAVEMMEEATHCGPSDPYVPPHLLTRTVELKLSGGEEEPHAPMSVDQKEAAQDKPALGPVDLRPTDILACSFSLDQKLALEALVEQHAEEVAPGHTSARVCLRLDAETFEPLHNAATPECAVQVTLTADGAVSLMGAEDMPHLERAAREVYRLLRRWGVLVPPSE